MREIKDIFRRPPCTGTTNIPTKNVPASMSPSGGKNHKATSINRLQL